MPLTAAQSRPLPDTAERRQLRCSFCGKDADHVRFLAAGASGGMICDRCNLKSFGIFLKAYLVSALRMVRS